MTDPMTPVGLYIHVPFCRARCHFCAFYLQIHRSDRAEKFVASLLAEMRLHAKRDTLSGRRLSTVYFGGGTPTTLEIRQVVEVMSTAQSLFGFEDGIELSIEAHPDSVTRDRLGALADAGFNRISFGVQSTDENELRRVGRPAVANGLSAMTAARDAGFRNINADLMYGLPGQTVESWRGTLEATLSAEPTHLSCYALTVEDDTQLAREVARGACPEPDSNVQDDMEHVAVRLLEAEGFSRYEISNFGRLGYACRHNLLYWSDQDYLGLGPSAQSYVDGVRFGNVESLERYEATLNTDRLPIAERVTLTAQQRGREAIAFGLRRLEGVEIRLVEALTRDDLDHPWLETLERFVQDGLLERQDGRLKLSVRGRRVADSVGAALI